MRAEAPYDRRGARYGQAEARQLGFPAPPPEGCAFIEVADNGPGIPPEALSKIFEPFFTTKPVGEGTGLGLSITHGIISAHGGRIEVESRKGEGTCFRIRLPGEAVGKNG